MAAASSKAATATPPELTSEVLENADDIFKRGRKSTPSPYQADVKNSLDTGTTRRIPAADEEKARVITNGLRKAARELNVSLQVKLMDDFVVFRAKAKPATPAAAAAAATS